MEERRQHPRSECPVEEEHAILMRVIFGDEAIDEKGMKDKVDEMHKLLVQAKNVGGFFGGVKALAGWLLVIGALVALFKGWLVGIITWATFN